MIFNSVIASSSGGSETVLGHVLYERYAIYVDYSGGTSPQRCSEGGDIHVLKNSLVDIWTDGVLSVSGGIEKTSSGLYFVTGEFYASVN